jgi:dienelactone hydrolase
MKTEKPTGTVSTIHGLETYVATPPNAPKGLIVMIPDIFGWETNNSRLLADSLSQDGDFLVYLPDFMNGPSSPPSPSHHPPTNPTQAPHHPPAQWS